MNEKSQEAVKKISNAGVANLVIGIITVCLMIPLLLILLVLMVTNVELHALAGSGSTPARESSFLLFILFSVLILSIIHIFTIVAGVKMRKDPQKAKGWTIFAVVVGAIQFSSITGIILLIFNVIALMAFKDIDEPDVVEILPAEKTT